MDAKGYTVLNEDTLPNFLKGKPPVTICLVFALTLVFLTLVSVTIGVAIGYTYCYMEYRHNMNSGIVHANITRTNVNIVPLAGRPDNITRTINDALMNNYYISQVLRFCGLKGDKSSPVEMKKKLPRVFI